MCHVILSKSPRCWNWEEEDVHGLPPHHHPTHPRGPGVHPAVLLDLCFKDATAAAALTL